ncbi:carboxymuconolactone decarboxylase family protein [Sphingobacterium sp. UT-1RO-CII-1]|uniref:carboxymuconolactone decarboxylase family protein n=1 Tax=Sphingobacterium sp. UT-1RO-CII-1 TaxID=2995225 RepID=UPI00227AA56E|nr:carboxymuconolactone decarboxylase family protein [Sphingobacterium sp. UT-1RO-CII-1]MCY4778578.1 carboxymuconolactone decarboxylase family protein [Sphingobacterium sp. UT-1RO-CII-1]
MKKTKIIVGLALIFNMLLSMQNSYSQTAPVMRLNAKEQNLVSIGGLAAKGDLQRLKSQLEKGLNAGLTVNQIKESLIHVYAYAGFPRSIRALQTFMTVIDERKARGIVDADGIVASTIDTTEEKYERGKEVLKKLTGVRENETKTGYAAFAPIIEVFLKEHLFADIFERDVLNYSERELVTVAVLSSIGGVEPMLRSHLNICLHLGLTSEQLQQCVDIIATSVGEKEAEQAHEVLNEVLLSKK